MRHGFLKVAAVTPKIRVADPKYNAQVICEKLEEAYERGAKVIVFPELSLTGYSCGDLFFQKPLQKAVLKGLMVLVSPRRRKQIAVKGTEVLMFQPSLPHQGVP